MLLCGDHHHNNRNDHYNPNDNDDEDDNNDNNNNINNDNNNNDNNNHNENNHDDFHDHKERSGSEADKEPCAENPFRSQGCPEQDEIHCQRDTGGRCCCGCSQARTDGSKDALEGPDARPDALPDAGPDTVAYSKSNA